MTTRLSYESDEAGEVDRRQCSRDPQKKREPTVIRIPSSLVWGMVRILVLSILYGGESYIKCYLVSHSLCSRLHKNVAAIRL